MNLYELYNYYMYEIADPRALDYWLLESIWPIAVILIFYYYFVTVWGPKFMKNREPYNVDALIKVYNFVQILWNLRLFFYGFEIAIASTKIEPPETFSFWCMPMTFSNDHPVSKAAFPGGVSYAYNKLFDLFDTVFFVLRKKKKQISYVHVYHHILMTIGSWIYVKYSGGGCPTSAGVLNALIHVIMYTYYQLSIMGLHEWTQWKIYLTQIQMVQFSLIFIHNISVFFNGCDNYNGLLSFLAAAQALYLAYLFTHFYIATYKKGGKNKKN